MKPKLAVIRALDIRVVQAEYAAAFKEFQGIYVSNYHQEIAKFFAQNPEGWRKLRLRAPYGFNPMENQQSWLDFEPKELAANLKGMDLWQIQEPFFLYSGQVAKLAQKLNKPLVTAPWMCFNHASTYIPPYCWAVNQVFKRTDLFLMRTQRVGRYLDIFKVPESKRRLVYHGINTYRFFPAKSKTSGKIKILFVGELIRHKGFEDILDIWPKLNRLTKQKIELVVCGWGPGEARLKAMVKVGGVKWLGRVLNLNMPEVYQQADIFCGPSRDWWFGGVKRTEEGMGFVFLEAMASGLPVVTNDCGAIKEVVGENNFINRQGDQKALLESLLALIEDEKLRLKIGRENRLQAVEKFDLAKQVAKEAAVMRKLI